MIEARGLTKRYDSAQLALDDVSFRVNPGEIYCLLGASGAGKTTLLRVFLSAIRPTGGVALIGDVDAVAIPREARRQAMFVAGGALYAALTARQNIEFLVRMSGNQPLSDRRAVENAMRRAGIPERDFDRKARDLTPDVLVLAWFAIAFVRQVKAVLLDEPIAGLGARAIAEVHDCLADLRQEGAAVLLATSNVASAIRIADRIGILQSGRKVAERARADLLGQSLSQFYEDYAGQSVLRIAPSSPGGRIGDTV